MRDKYKILALINTTALVVFLLSYPFIAEAQLTNVAPDPLSDIQCENESEVIPTCLLHRTRAENAQELITGDLRVCTCLAKNNHLFQDFMPPTNEEIRREREKTRLLNNASIKTGNLAVVQASSHVQDKKGMDKAVLAYSQSEARIATDELRKQEEIAPPQLSRNATEINIIEESNRSWQCVTFQEYSVQREIPFTNDFFALLKNTPTFNPSEWNANTLQGAFNAANQEEKDKITLKLTFLSRNPIFQSIMKAEPTEHITAEKIATKQNELYSILQNLRPADNSNCQAIPNGCWREVHDNGSYESYSEQVGEFINNNDVIDIASSQAATDYSRELERIISGDSSIPSSPEGYFRYLQTANTEISQKCSGTTVEASCYTQFQDHCNHIKLIDVRIREGIKRSSIEVISELDEEASIHAMLDPATNPSFRSFNDKICLQPLTNATGESLTFFQYQDKYCQTQQPPLPECTKRQQLLSRYLRDYNAGGESSDQSLRSGFASIVGESRYIEISEAQVVAANNLTETPRELRARFNNEFPSISSTGQLVPPLLTPIAAGSSPYPVGTVPGVDSGSFPSLSDSSSGSTSFTSRSASPSFSNPSRSSPRSSSSNFLPEFQMPELMNSLQLPPISPGPVQAPGGNSLFSDSLAQIQNRRTFIENDEPQRENAGIIPSQDSINPDRSPASLNAIGAASVAGSVSPIGSPGGSDSPVVQRASGNTSSGGGSRSSPAKYNLKGSGGVNRPEVAIVSPTTKLEVNVEIPSRQLNRIKANPNALILSPEKIQEILSSPEEEVKLILETENGENLVVFAKKDSNGGLSFALRPSAPEGDRSPASVEGIVRINVTGEMYDSVVSAPDVFLNQNELLMEEVSRKGSGLILQIVSPGKTAKVYEVKKVDEFLYSFQEK